MIKIAVFNIGKGMYSAFSLNQEYPLATVVKAPLAGKHEIERILILRFHSQRNEYKKIGKDIEPINSNGKRRGGWKFIWTPVDILYKKLEPVCTKEEVLVNEPGLTITKKSPLAESMEKVLPEEITGKIIKEKMGIASMNDGQFRFTEIKGDIIGVSQIPEYIAAHSTEE